LASVFAIRDCELRFVGRDAFEECMAQHPEIYRYLDNVLAARLRETNEAVAAANFLTVEARLARAAPPAGRWEGYLGGVRTAARTELFP